jgi:hypothetical protein
MENIPDRGHSSMLHWGAWQPIFLVQNTRMICLVELIVMHTEQRVPTAELMDEQYTALPSFWFSASLFYLQSI